MRFHPLRAASLACVLLAAGCSTTPAPPPNQGTTGGRMEPSRDHASERGIQAPRSVDIINASDQMAASIARRADINDPANPPTIVLGSIENRTRTLRGEDMDLFLLRLRSGLNQSDARQGIEFVRERDFIEQQRTREYGGKDPASTAQQYLSRADYMMTGELMDLPAGGTNYYFLSVQLVQLRDATGGPDRGAGSIVWESSYEVKFN